MIVSTSRPYFAPFAGFFHQAHLCDIFVILDNVQFPRGTTWITRNRFKNDHGTMWMTISVFDLLFNCGPKARDILITNK